MREKAKNCIDCGSPEVVERKRCKSCVLVFNRERVKKYRKKDNPRYGIITCFYCQEKMIKNRPDQIMHGDCKKKMLAEKKIDYNLVPRTKDGKRTAGRDVIFNLGFNLNKMVVHHIDENPLNNEISNLMIISYSNHAKLHRFLETQWSLFRKLNNSNSENCWDILRGQLTTAWLEMTNVNVIKIIDIGQSAAEPLNKDNVYVFA